MVVVENPEKSSESPGGPEYYTFLRSTSTVCRTINFIGSISGEGNQTAYLIVAVDCSQSKQS